MPFNKQFKTKLVSLLVGLTGFGTLSIVGMNLFQNLLNSVTSMSTTSSTGIVEIPSVNGFFMQFLDTTSIIGIGIGTILVVIGCIGYMWYPIMDLKNQVGDIFNHKDDEMNHCYK